MTNSNQTRPSGLESPASQGVAPSVQETPASVVRKASRRVADAGREASRRAADAEMASASSVWKVAPSLIPLLGALKGFTWLWLAG
jgi:hypothetical protein